MNQPDALSVIQSIVKVIHSPLVVHNHLLNCLQIDADNDDQLDWLVWLATRHLNSLGVDYVQSSFPCRGGASTIMLIYIGSTANDQMRNNAALGGFTNASRPKYYAAIAKGDKNKAVYGVGSSHSEALNDADEWCGKPRTWRVHECSFAAYSDIRQNGWHGQTAIEDGVVVLSDEYVD